MWGIILSTAALLFLKQFDKKKGKRKKGKKGKKK